jgi:hypothetical protein
METFDMSDTEEYEDTKACKKIMSRIEEMHVQDYCDRLVENVFIRNKTTISACLRIIMAIFATIDKESPVSNIVTEDGKKLLSFSYEETSKYFIFEDFRKTNVDDVFEHGRYQYRISNNQTSLLCKLMLPLAVEVASFPQEWKVKISANENLTFIEFASDYCDIILK